MRLRSRLGIALWMTLFAVSYIPDAAIAQTSPSNQKQAPSKDKPKQNQSANKVSAAKPGSTNKTSKTTKPAKAGNAGNTKKTKDVRVSVTRPANNASTGARPSFATAMGLRGQHDELSLKSSVAMVVNQDTNDVLFEKNTGVSLPIASITKLMAAMVVLDAD